MKVCIGIWIYVLVLAKHTADESGNLPFWPIPKSENELEHEKCQVPYLQQVIDNRCGLVAERPSVEFVCTAWRSYDVQDDRTCKPIRG